MCGQAIMRTLAANRLKLGVHAIGAVFCAMLLSIGPASMVQAAVTWSGDVDPGYLTGGGPTYYIGQSSAGTIIVSGGSSIQCWFTYLGYNSGSTGTVTITGNNSKWSLTNDFIVGNSGSGTFNIAAGGQASSSGGYLGYNSGSTGAATVTGVGSTWTNRGNLYVGYSGNGTLNVTDGGTVSTRTLYASMSSLLGNGAITAQGAVLDGNVVFDASHGLQQTLAFGTTGTLTLNSNGSGDWGAGYRGIGTLRIADGVAVSSSSGYLGYHSASTGIATVTGAGSTWTNSGSLYVGYSGNGTLTVANGGAVTTRTLYASISDLLGDGTITTQGAILDADLVFDRSHGVQAVASFGEGGTLNVNTDGNNGLGVGYKGAGTMRIADGVVVTSWGAYLGSRSGSTGKATVTGAGSQWISGALYVGDSGDGTLTVSDGGAVTTGALFASLDNLLGNGTIIASGGVLDGDLVFKGVGEAVCRFGTGGTLTLRSSSRSVLGVGYKNAGTLTVSDRARFNSYSGVLGDRSGSNGIATITGAGSLWTNTENFFIGHEGNGTLNIEAGAEVSVGYIYQGTRIGRVYLGENTGSTGTAIVTGTGSKWTSTSDLYVGSAGSGRLTIAAGGQVISESAYLGYGSGSTGTATVTGAGSQWIISTGLYVGRDGSGTLSVADGGLVTAEKLFASLSDLSGNGTITVTKGAMLDADIVFDSAHGSQPTIAFGTGGKLNLKLDGSGMLGVGYKGDGSLRIADGIKIKSTPGTLGYYAGSNGTATVSGVGSTWSNDGNLVVGSSGNGILSISSSGRVSCSDGCLGSDSGSTGTVTVNGAGSTLYNDGVYYVGRSGNGILNIEAGGKVDSSAGSLGGNPGSTGVTMVTGNGSTWTNRDYGLDVGGNGDGTLTIAAGGKVSNSYGYAGFGSGATGRVLVTGAGSTWNNSGYLSLGAYGSGTLNIEDGGQVTSSTGCIGRYSGSTGTVTVTGPGSKWTNAYELYVGKDGSGTLTVANGGTVSAKTLYASVRDLKGDGLITVTGGAILDADLVYDNAHPSTQTIAFGTGGTLKLSMDGANPFGIGYKGLGTLTIADGRSVNCSEGYLGYNSGSTATATITGVASKWANSGSLFVGYSGSGILNITAGARVNSSNGNLGSKFDSTGTVTVTGEGSTWSAGSALLVGCDGRGTLTVTDGGMVSTGMLYASISDLLGDGTISAYSGMVLDADVVLDGTPGGTQTIPFGTGGKLRFGKTGILGVGYKGVGTLRIADGVAAKSATTYMGYCVGSTGTAVISGIGSKWTNVNQPSYVGYSGTGVLNITAGAQVSCTDGQVGYNAGSTGTATVTGTGSTWTESGKLYVGNWGCGRLNIAAGGQVNNNIGYLGYNVDATGTATVTGTGSKWTNNNSFYVGYYGNGTLNIDTGAQVSSPYSYLGNYAGSTGTVTVTGAGSMWSSGNVTIGDYGNGTLNIEAGAQVTNTEAVLGSEFHSTGKVTVTGVGSRWINSGGLYVGFSVGLSGSGTLNVTSGGTVTALNVSIASQSLLAIDVGYGSLLTVGGGTGTINNNGMLRFVAGSSLKAGDSFSPISAGTLSGSGAFQALGGTWDSTTRTFTVSETLSGTSGSAVAIDLAQRQRVLISEGSHGWSVGASLLAKTGTTAQMNFTATAIGGDTLTSLNKTLDAGQMVVGGWTFSATGSGYTSGDPMYLSFAVGEGRSRSDLDLWRYTAGQWTAYSASDLTCNGPYASFTTTELGTFALTAPVPEPSTFALLGMAAVAAIGLAWQRGKKKSH